MPRRPREWQVLATVALLASVVRFTFEIRVIEAHCCYDFPTAFGRAVGFATRHAPFYPTDLASYAPGVGDFKYPPLYALLLLLVADSGFREPPLGTYLGLQIILYFASVALLARAFGLDRRSGCAFLFTLVALNFGPVFETLLRLQIEMLVLFCLAVTALCLARRREGLAGAAIAAATMLKIYPALAIVPFARRRARALLGFAAGLAVISAISLYALGWKECEQYFSRALPVMMKEAPIETYHAENASIGRWLTRHLAVEPANARRLGDSAAVVATVVTLLVLWRQRREGPVTGTELGTLVPVMLLTLPNSWANYQLLLLVPIAAILGRAASVGWHHLRFPLMAVLVSVLATTYHIDAYNYPFWLHIFPRFFGTLQDHRVWVSLLLWVAMLAVLLHDGRRLRLPLGEEALVREPV